MKTDEAHEMCSCRECYVQMGLWLAEEYANSPSSVAEITEHESL